MDGERTQPKPVRKWDRAQVVLALRERQANGQRLNLDSVRRSQSDLATVGARKRSSQLCAAKDRAAATKAAMDAIIDWEECATGEPLFDLALARLDLLWVLGHAAVADFTRIYQSLTGVNLLNLPYWDLAVSLRPTAGIEDWARTSPDLGRPDVTCETMIRDHGDLVEQALHLWPPA
jgi:hypothetical protein